MPRKKVLVLHSLRDEVSERHARQISMSPRLRAYDIGHAFLLDHAGHGLDMNPEEVLVTLRDHIDKFIPDIILVHIGITYHLERKRYLDLVNGLIRVYPSVLFVADKYIPDNDGFEGIRLGDDPEIDRLILAFEGP